MFDDGDGPVFDDLSPAEWDLVTLANTDLDIEPLYAHDPDVHPPLDTEAGRWARGEVELELVAAVEQQIAFLHAVQTRALARFAALRPGRRGQDYSDFVADEIGLAAHWTTAYAGSRLALAFTLTERLPGTLQALARGDIDLRRAQRLAEITAAATPSVARAIEDTVLPDAVDQNSAELSRAARKTLLQLDPDGAAERHRERKKERRVELNPLDDAMAELRAYLTAPEADRIYHTIDAYAQACRAPFDPRTADQRRADAFCDLILDLRYPTPNSHSTGTDGTTDTGTGTGDVNNSGADAATTDSTDHAGSTDDTGSTANQTAAATTPDTTGTSASGATRTSSTGTNNAGTTTGSADVTDTTDADRTYTGARDTRSDSATGAGTAGTTDTGNATIPASRAGTHSDSVSGDTSSTGSESVPAAGDANISSGTDAATTGRNDADSTTSQTGAGAGTIRTRGTNGSGSTHAATTGSQITPRTSNQTTPATSAGSQTAAPAGISTGRAGGNRVVGRPSAQVHVTVPLATLLGLDNQPADLAGYGPIHADLARELAADGVWRRLVTDPLSGLLLDYGRTTYRPPAALADFVRARDRRCVFPGCGRKATCCDLDHTVCYPDGPTSECNLACLCRHHHRLKHESEWTLHRDGDQFIWTAPTGLQYVRKPESLTPPVPPPTPLPPPDDEPPPF